MLEIGTACLRNFIELGKQWMGLDLSSYSLYLMPIGFLPSGDPASGVSVSNDEQNLVNYLAKLMREGNQNDVQDYHVSLDINISFRRTSTAAANAIMVINDPNDPNAIHVNLSEDDIRKQYPWDYETLTFKLKNRYIDFKTNLKYHYFRKQLAANPQFMKTRYLDPANTSGQRKDFYNPNIQTEFDRVYTRRK